jgi:hypothetical protein
VWIALGFSGGGSSSLARSGGAISGTGCIVPHSFAAGGKQSYPDFWAITGDPRYPGYQTPTVAPEPSVECVFKFWLLNLIWFKGFKNDFWIQTKYNLDSNQKLKTRIWKIDSRRVWGPNYLGIFPKISYAFLGFLGMKMNGIWVNFGAFGPRNIPKVF